MLPYPRALLFALLLVAPCAGLKIGTSKDPLDTAPSFRLEKTISEDQIEEEQMDCFVDAVAWYQKASLKCVEKEFYSCKADAKGGNFGEKGSKGVKKAMRSCRDARFYSIPEESREDYAQLLACQKFLIAQGTHDAKQAKDSCFMSAIENNIEEIKQQFQDDDQHSTTETSTTTQTEEGGDGSDGAGSDKMTRRAARTDGVAPAFSYYNVGVCAIPLELKMEKRLFRCEKQAASDLFQLCVQEGDTKAECRQDKREFLDDVKSDLLEVKMEVASDLEAMGMADGS